MLVSSKSRSQVVVWLALLGACGGGSSASPAKGGTGGSASAAKKDAGGGAGAGAKKDAGGGPVTDAGSATRDGGGTATTDGGAGGLELMSTAFMDGSKIAAKYRCMAPSPDLSWKGAPSATKSYAVVLEDVTMGFSKGFLHWVIYDIANGVTSLT